VATSVPLVLETARTHLFLDVFNRLGIRLKVGLTRNLKTTRLEHTNKSYPTSVRALF